RARGNTEYTGAACGSLRAFAMAAIMGARMFPLAGKDSPTSATALASGIERALAEVFELNAAAGPAVSVAGGGDFPRLQQLRINLNGARVRATTPPPKPLGIGERKPGITVEHLQISGYPLRYEQAKLD